MSERIDWIRGAAAALGAATPMVVWAGVVANAAPAGDPRGLLAAAGCASAAAGLAVLLARRPAPTDAALLARAAQADAEAAAARRMAERAQSALDGLCAASSGVPFRWAATGADGQFSGLSMDADRILGAVGIAQAERPIVLLDGAAERWATMAAAAVAGGGGFGMEARVRLPGGGERTVWLAATPAPDGGLAGFLLDASALAAATRTAEALRARLREIEAGSIQGVAVFRGARLEECDGAFAALLGWADPDSARGAVLLTDLFPHGTPGAIGAQHGRPGTVRVEVARRDGGSACLDVAVLPVLRDGQHAVQVCAVEVSAEAGALRRAETAERALSALARNAPPSPAAGGAPGLVEQVEAALARCAAEDRPLALLVVEVDAEDGGDPTAMLEEAETALRDAAADAVCGRLGASRAAAALPGADAAAAFQAAERVRVRVHRACGGSVSVGVACCAPGGPALSQRRVEVAVASAREALVAARSNGGDRVAAGPAC